jgi:lysophospholipase L1-like esterase
MFTFTWWRKIVSSSSHRCLAERRTMRPSGRSRFAVARDCAAGVVVAGSLTACATGTPTPTASAHPGHTVIRAQRTDGPCTTLLRDTPQYGVVPIPPDKAARIQPVWLVKGRLEWSGSKRLSFSACPPKKVLVIGDSLAFSLGLGAMIGEQRYDVEVVNAAILACAFTTKGKIDQNGKIENQPPECKHALRRWAHIARTLRPGVVIVEMGHRDKFNWLIDGHMTHLGQRAFDTYVQRQIDEYVRTLAQGGTRVLFLSVPWAHFRPLANGSSPPQASARRHATINAMLQSTVRRFPGEAGYFNIDGVISPGNRYQGRVHGQLCRFDGIHFSIYCSRLLQRPVLRAALKLNGS